MSDKELTLTGEPRKSNAGRKRGAKNRIKIPTDADLKESFMKASPHALEKMLTIMQNGSESNQLKCAFKISDVAVNIMYEDEKIAISKHKLDGSSSTTTIIDTSTDKADKPTSGKVLSFK